jgi:hypothetical protein
MTTPEESSSTVNSDNNLPLDSAPEFLDWLKKYHDPEVVESVPYEQNPPQAFNYEGITVEDTEVAMKAVQEQRSQEPETMLKLLKNLSPAQIILLASDPSTRLYTEQEMFDLMKKEVKEEKERLSQFADTKEVVNVQPGTVKFLHATRGDVSEHNYIGDIMTDGLFCHDEGLAGVAVRLSEDNDEHNLGVLAQRHKNYPGVISIVLPLPEDEKMRDEIQRFHRRGAGSRVGIDGFLAREIPDEEKVRLGGAGIDYDYILPGKFIQGYFDTQKGEFVKNPNFNPQLSNDDLEHIKERIKQFSG